MSCVAECVRLCMAVDVSGAEVKRGLPERKEGIEKKDVPDETAVLQVQAQRDGEERMFEFE